MKRPPADAIAWSERTIGRGARVVGWRRLTGGLTSAVHRLTVEHRGRRQMVVLRRWASGSDLAAYGIGAVKTETAALAALADSDIPAPRVLGSTTDAAFGPAVLMTRVPGHIHLAPSDRWLGQMAHTLAKIHALPIAAKPFESWLDRTKLAPPADSRRPKLWRDAIALVAKKPPRGPTGFMHRDYQHFNVLWSRERLTGVVDWVEASIGPPSVDVGHCRLNLALLFSAQVAERFRAAYEAESGRAVEPWWDIHALLSYDASWKRFLPFQVGGRAPLDADGMTSRVEQLLAVWL